MTVEVVAGRMAPSALLLTLMVVTTGAAPAGATRSPGDTLTSYLEAPEEMRDQVARDASARLTVGELIEAIEAREARRPARRAGLHQRTIQVGDVTAPYIVVAPRGYDSKRPWPMHISLHGGGKPDRYNERTCLDHDWGRRGARDALLVCPTTPVGRWWTPAGDAMVSAVYREVLREWRVDRSRVSIGGMSNGGTGAWHMAMKYPWLWSAVVPRCAGEIRDDRYVTNMAALPVHMIHGDRDSLIPVESSLAMDQRLRRAGNEPTLRVIKGGRHRFFSRLNRSVMRWLKTQRRAAPDTLDYTALPDSDRNPPGLVAWIHAPGALRVQASWSSIEGGAQLTLAGAELPDRATIYVPSRFAAEGAKLRVLFDGRVVHDGPMIAKVVHLLESYRLTEDRERSYPFGVVVDLSAPEPGPQSREAPSGAATQRTP